MLKYYLIYIFIFCAGGENVLVGRMIQQNGGLHLKGKSVHNQRIERMWRDCRLFCFDFFTALFSEMECEDILDSTNSIHIAALQYVFIPRLNRALNNFSNAHNNRPCRSLHNRTPSQSFILSRLNYTPDVPEELPAIEEHIPITLSVLNIDDGEQIERLRDELVAAVPDPLVQTPDHGIGMFRAAVQVVENFVNHV